MIISRFYSKFLASFHELLLASKAYLSIQIYLYNLTYHLFGYEVANLPLHKVADTHFHIQGHDICNSETMAMGRSMLVRTNNFFFFI